MPQYEFACLKCKSEKTVFTKKVMTSRKVIKCKCGYFMTKQMSVGAFHFKGSGFYSTDYKNKTGK